MTAIAAASPAVAVRVRSPTSVDIPSLALRYRTPQQRQRESEACNLCQDKAWRIHRTDAGEGVAQSARYGHRWIGEGGRSREPIGAGNVCPDREGRYRLVVRAATPDYRQQAERRDDLGDPLRQSRAGVLRELPDRQVEHDMREPHTEDGAHDLGGNIGRGCLPA